jgi:hypothetical protein
MKNAAEDVLLKNILLDAACVEFEEELSNKEAVTTSPRFRRQMRDMVKNPARWARRKRRPIWKQALQIAAIFMVVSVLSFGFVAVAIPSAHAAIVEWLTEKYENSIIYRFWGAQDSGEMPEYGIAQIPYGYYETTDSLELINNSEKTYVNGKGDTIRLEYLRVEDGSAIVIDTEAMEVSEIEVSGKPGHLYISQNHEQTNCITWYDAEQGIQFMIDGYLTADELIGMAESVELKE